MTKKIKSNHGNIKTEAFLVTLKAHFSFQLQKT